MLEVAPVRRAGKRFRVDRARDHPARVRVHDRMPIAVREDRDGARRVVADPGQREQLVDVARNDALVNIADLGGRAVQPKRTARIAEVRPAGYGLRGEASARSVGVGQRSSQVSSSGITRATGVCCSMNSLTRVPHAPNPGRRQGRSRAVARYQGTRASDRSFARILTVYGERIVMERLPNRAHS